MTFTVSSTELLSRLQNISKALPAKSPAMSILERFLFEIENNVLTLTASDNDVTLRTDVAIKASSDEAVSMAMPAKMLTDLLKEIPEQPITFDVDTASLRVVLNTSSGIYSFTATDGREYPEIVKLAEENEDTKCISLQQNQILTAISRTIFGAATDDSRPVMTGINCVFNEKGMICEATDAHKMVRFINSGVSNAQDGSFILPRKTAQLLKSLLGTEEIDIKILFNKKYISLDLPDYHMICRQIEGLYPKLDSIIPMNNDKEIIVDKNKLLAACVRLERVADKQSKQLTINIAENVIKIEAADMVWHTSGKESVECSADGIEIRIGFKAPMLIDVLREIPDDAVVIKLSEPNRAGIIIPQKPLSQTENMLTLLMPMLLN